VQIDRIRRFAYEKWVCFFEKFYVDGEEEIVMRLSGFIFFCLVDTFLQFFKVQNKFDPFIDRTIDASETNLLLHP
jgi:hypothetical protein